MKIYIVSRPQLEMSAVSAFLDDEDTTWRQTVDATAAEQLIELAGRVCYMSFGTNQSPRSNAEYINNLIRMGHESVLEHACWTFIVSGVSRAFTHQLVRHRIGFSFSQLSQQYHDEVEAEFIKPAQLTQYPEAEEAWKSAVTSAKESYRKILDVLGSYEAGQTGLLGKREARRAIRSAARSVLPNATSSVILVTANARALRHFFRVRGTIPGDFEMREVAASLLGEIIKDAPNLFNDFSIEQLADGPIIRHLPIMKDTPSE